MKIRYRVRDLLLLTAMAAIVIAIVRWYVMAAPDLIITNVTFSPQSPKVGEGIQATIRYKNVGRKIANDFYLHHSKGPEGFGYGLGKGELFSIDPQNSVNEVSEGNNSFPCQITIHD